MTGKQLTQTKEIIELALTFAKDCAASYRKARPEVRKMWNRAFFREIFVEEGNVIRFEYEEPFATLLGSHRVQNCGGEGMLFKPPEAARRTSSSLMR